MRLLKMENFFCVDDTQRGGDIDLYNCKSQSWKYAWKKIKFLALLKQLIGYQNIVADC